MLKLIKLTPELEAEYFDLMAEYHNEKMIPMAADLGDKTYQEFLTHLALSEFKENLPEQFVPATLYFLTDDNGRLLGSLNFRHYLNDNLLICGGHIGYGIRPSERNKGYATAQLKLALPIAKSRGLDKVLVTCDDDNEASARTILSCGGVFEDKREDNGKLIRRYWITL